LVVSSLTLAEEIVGVDVFPGFIKIIDVKRDRNHSGIFLSELAEKPFSVRAHVTALRCKQFHEHHSARVVRACLRQAALAKECKAEENQ
jgi:hypothetical protein